MQNITQMHTSALNNEMEARRVSWQLAQNIQTYGQRMILRKQNRINVLLQEKGILQLII